MSQSRPGLIEVVATRPEEIIQPTYYIGVITHDPKCLAVPHILADMRELYGAHIIGYGGTKWSPREPAARASKRTRDDVLLLLRKRCSRISTSTVNAYQFSSIFRALSMCLEYSDAAASIVIDVSGFTNIHVVALALWLEQCSRSGSPRIFIANTEAAVRDQHKRLPPPSVGVGPLIYAPLGSPAPAVKLGQGRSLVDVVTILGHDDRRLPLSLAPLEVDNGIAILLDNAYPTDSDDVSYLARERFLSDARKNRLGRWEILGDAEWGDYAVALLSDLVERSKTRVVLIPFGPRAVVVEVAVALRRAAQQHQRPLWISYVLPESYRLRPLRAAGKPEWLAVQGAGQGG